MKKLLYALCALFLVGLSGCRPQNLSNSDSEMFFGLWEPTVNGTPSLFMTYPDVYQYRYSLPTPEEDKDSGKFSFDSKTQMITFTNTRTGAQRRANFVFSDGNKTLSLMFGDGADAITYTKAAIN